MGCPACHKENNSSKKPTNLVDFSVSQRGKKVELKGKEEVSEALEEVKEVAEKLEVAKDELPDLLSALEKVGVKVPNEIDILFKKAKTGDIEALEELGANDSVSAKELRTFAKSFGISHNARDKKKEFYIEELKKVFS